MKELINSWNKESRMFIIVSLVMLLFVVCVHAISIDSPLYNISCSPEVSAIQSNGFNQFCDYTWKGMNNLSEDVAFCFDTTLARGTIYLINADSSKTDISALFKFKHYNMTKGECYYVQSVLFQPNKTINTLIQYLPLNLSASPKWDTYFGNITLNRIDLKLDPIYNTSLYEVGTSRASNYYWLTTLNPYVINGDVASSTAILHQQNITNFQTKGMRKEVYPFTYDRLGAHTLTLSLMNIQALQNCSITAIDSSFAGNCQSNLSYVIYNENMSLLASGINRQAVSQFNITKDAKYFLGIYCDYVVGFYTPPTPIVRSFDDSCFKTLAVPSGVVSVNTTAYYDLPSSNVTSNNISLPILVNTFRMNNVFSGQAFINITFDGINYNYLNLSNNSLISLPDNILDNNNLQYKLSLLTSSTTINNLSISFNGLINRLDISIHNSTNSFITQPINVSLIDLTNYTLQTNITSLGYINFTNLNLGTYRLTFSGANFSTNSYYVNMSSGMSSSLDVYLSNIGTSSPVTFSFKNTGGNPLGNVLTNIYGFINGTLKLLSSDVSDSTGNVQFSLSPNTYYRLDFSKNNYQNNSIEYFNILSSTYTITMFTNSESGNSVRAFTSWSPQAFFPNQNDTLDFTFNSSGYLTAYNVQFSYPFGFNYSSGNNPYGEVFNMPFFINQSSSMQTINIFYEYWLSNGQYFNNTYSYNVYPSSGNNTVVNFGKNNYGFQVGDSILITTLIILLLAGAVFIGTGSIIATLGVSAALYAVFMSNNFIPPEIGYVVIAIAVLIIIARGGSSG